VLRTGTNPYILRPTENGCHQFVGECYSYQLSTDEKVAEWQEKLGRKDEWFHLR
jgi:hypothetical protein